jgi:hypothetical protein
MSTLPVAPSRRWPRIVLKTAVFAGTAYISTALFVHWLDIPDYARMRILDKCTAFMTDEELQRNRELLSRPKNPWWKLW